MYWTKLLKLIIHQIKSKETVTVRADHNRQLDVRYLNIHTCINSQLVCFDLLAIVAEMNLTKFELFVCISKFKIRRILLNSDIVLSKILSNLCLCSIDV